LQVACGNGLAIDLGAHTVKRLVILANKVRPESFLFLDPRMREDDTRKDPGPSFAFT